MTQLKATSGPHSLEKQTRSGGSILALSWGVSEFLRARAKWLLPLLLAVVGLSRLPFLGAGYGGAVDAWRVARVARQLSETGIYEVSRFPGYPVQEIVCSWLWRGGPWALNGASAICSLAAVWAFVACARRIGCRDSLLAGLALAMTPVFFVNSVTSKDYVWALALALGSLLCILRRRPLTAGLLLGVAIGCRITSAALLLPLGLILWGEIAKPQRWRAVVGFCLTSCATAGIVFVPVWMRYSTSFFTFYSHARPDLAVVAWRASDEVWGSLGLVGLAAVLIGMVVRWSQKRGEKPSLPPVDNPLLLPALGLIIVIYGAAYWRLPDQAAYLIPIIPATLLLAVRLAPRPCFQFCCLCLTISPLLEVGPVGLHAGAIFADHTERLINLRNLNTCLDFAETLPGKNVIVVGGWEPEIAVLAPDRPALRNQYVYLLSQEEINNVRKNGGLIFYLPAMRSFNAQVHGVDLARSGFDLFALYQARRATVGNN